MIDVLVFPSDWKGRVTKTLSHLASPRKAWLRVLERAKIENLRIHDLRRTAGNYMAIQGVSPTIIGKALGHRSPQATANLHSAHSGSRSPSSRKRPGGFWQSKEIANAPYWQQQIEAPSSVLNSLSSQCSNAAVFSSQPLSSRSEQLTKQNDACMTKSSTRRSG